MIHFSCMYCGKKIRAKDKLVGRRAPCPACGHRLLIPKPTAAASDATHRDTQRRHANWSDQSNGMFFADIPFAEKEQARVALRQSMSPLVPRYDELTLFAMSVAFLLLLWINPEMRRNLSQAKLFVRDGRIILFIFLAALGMAFSLFGIFFKRPKPEVVKWPMLIFAVAVTAGTGIYAGYVAIKDTHSWLIVFPAWNIVNGLLLLFLLRAGLIAPDCIIDGAAKLSQLVITVLTVGLLLGLCQYVFELHWAISYSICIGYTMGLHHAITDLFGGVTSTDV